MAFDFKNSSKVELNKKYEEIANKIGDEKFFTKIELSYLPEIISDNEQILAFTSGLMDGNTWLITLTDRRVIFLDKGMIYGLERTTIDLDRVNSISGKTGIFFGEIFIEDGVRERHITNVWIKTVKTFTNIMQDAVENRKNLHHNANIKKQELDTYDKLAKLAKLKDKGIISQEEFNKEKEKVLG